MEKIKRNYAGWSKTKEKIKTNDHFHTIRRIEYMAPALLLVINGWCGCISGYLHLLIPFHGTNLNKIIIKAYPVDDIALTTVIDL